MCFNTQRMLYLKEIQSRLNLGENGNLQCVVTDSKFQTFTRLSVINNLKILPPVHKIICEWPNSNLNFDYGCNYIRE
jgi:hypothetical protein